MEYRIIGHTLENGVIPQVDMVLDLQDDRSRWSGPFWVIARTLDKSRTGGTTCTIEGVPLGALAF
jgi:hypothetical protein